MMLISNRVATIAVLSFVLIGALSACDSDSDEVQHPVAERVLVKSGNVTIVNASATEASGEIEIAQGVAAEVNIEFLDPVGNPLEHDVDEWLFIVISEINTLTWTPDQEGGFTGVLRGLAVGTVQIELLLMHGEVGNRDESHSDWDSAFITVNIVQ